MQLAVLSCALGSTCSANSRNSDGLPARRQPHDEDPTPLLSLPAATASTISFGALSVTLVPACRQLSLDLSAGVGLDVAGLAALAPTLRRLVLTVRGLQLAGLAALAELHRLRHLQLRIQRGFYTLPGDQVLKDRRCSMHPSSQSRS